MNHDKIPLVLRNRPQWIVWKHTARSGKPTKVPYQVNGSEAKANDPSTWTSFEQAFACYERGGYEGPGFEFSEGDPFCGIDLDGCRDPKSGEFAAWAKEIIRALDTYTEVSPSGTGAKLFLGGKLPWSSGKNVKLSEAPKVCGKEPAIELYDRGRYFAVTGLRLGGVSGEVESRQTQLDVLIAQYVPAQEFSAESWYSDESVLERARKYLAKLPPAVSGKSGHNACFHAACVLVLGFGLSENSALSLLREYNQVCQPPWSDKELLHKVQSAAKQGGPRNYLRNQRPDNWDRVQVPSYGAPAEARQPEPPRVVTLETATEKYLESIKGGKCTLVETGLPDVDYAIGGGVEPGEMVILGARPSHGKSMAALQVIHNMTSFGIPAVMVSEEMSSLALGKRVIQFASSVPEEYWSHEETKVSGHIKQHFSQRAPCYVVESCRTAERADEAIRRAIEEHACKLVVVDYAQLLGGRGKTRYEQITTTSITLRQLASQCGVIVLVLCQLGRSVEAREVFMPYPSDLKDSGQLEQDADVILFLCWPHRLDSKHDPHEFKMFIGKNRNRAVNAQLVECRFDPSRQTLRVRPASHFADPEFQFRPTSQEPF